MTKLVSNRSDFLNEVSRCLPDNSVAVEIGVLYGDFSQDILTAVRPTVLYLIDPYYLSNEKYSNGLPTAYSTESDYVRLLIRFQREIADDRVIVIKDLSSNVVSSYDDAAFDFIYIDASHLYKDAYRDLTEWLPKLKADGLLCGHDYIDLPEFGVIQAVDEFMVSNDLEMTILNTNGGDFALKRR